MNKQKFQLTLWFVVFTLVISACAPSGGNPGQPQATADGPSAGGESLAGTRWTLVSLGAPGNEVPVIEGSNVNLEFEDGGQAGGSGGCNSYSVQYQVAEKRIAFLEVVSTLMACDDPAVTNQEAQYLQALRSASRFTIAGDTMSILYDNDQHVLNFVRMAASTQPQVVSDAGMIPTGPDEKQYTLPAQAGQTITIEITSDGAPLSLTITSPSGVQRFPELSQAGGGFLINHTFSASESGDYQMALAKADQTPSTNYTATFTVR